MALLTRVWRKTYFLGLTLSRSGKLPRGIFSYFDRTRSTFQFGILPFSSLSRSNRSYTASTSNTMYYDIPLFHLFVLLFLSTGFLAQRMYTTFRLIHHAASVQNQLSLNPSLSSPSRLVRHWEPISKCARRRRQKYREPMDLCLTGSKSLLTNARNGRACGE
jgi:hypothetical protein